MIRTLIAVSLMSLLAACAPQDGMNCCHKMENGKQCAMMQEGKKCPCCAKMKKMHGGESDMKDMHY